MSLIDFSLQRKIHQHFSQKAGKIMVINVFIFLTMFSSLELAKGESDINQDLATWSSNDFCRIA